MLRKRIITALALAAPVLLAILYLPFAWYALFFFLFASLGVFEWASLCGIQSRAGQLGYVAAFAVGAWLIWQNPELWSAILVFSVGVWVIAAVLVCSYPRLSFVLKHGLTIALLGLAIFFPAWAALLAIRGASDGGGWLIWLMVVVTMADIGAYFSGKRFGRTKLAPQVSPGKTWEGVIGGLLFSMLISFSLLFAFSVETSQIISLLWIVVLLIVISVFGDLLESVIKRTRGVKDSGGLLPGHGGVLDRIDSLLAALPLFALYLSRDALPCSLSFTC